MSGRLDHSNDASDDTSSGRVVVGVHGSASSMDAVRWAAALARGQGWDLEIVAAWPDADDVFIHDVPGRFMACLAVPQRRRSAALRRRSKGCRGG